MACYGATESFSLDRRIVRRLPADRFMASVGNGHVATVLTSNTIFMNGLYSGKGGDSHRARIPARINIRIPAPTESARFVLNTEEGLQF